MKNRNRTPVLSNQLTNNSTTGLQNMSQVRVPCVGLCMGGVRCCVTQQRVTPHQGRNCGGGGVKCGVWWQAGNGGSTSQRWAAMCVVRRAVWGVWYSKVPTTGNCGVLPVWVGLTRTVAITLPKRTFTKHHGNNEQQNQNTITKWYNGR